MSPKLPRVNGLRLVRALEKRGFVERRRKGSHAHLFREADRRRVTVHIPEGTLRAILKDADITIDELRELL